MADSNSVTPPAASVCNIPLITPSLSPHETYDETSCSSTSERSCVVVVSTPDFKQITPSKKSTTTPSKLSPLKAEYHQLNIAIMGVSSRLATFQDTVLSQLRKIENMLTNAVQSPSENIWDFIEDPGRLSTFASPNVSSLGVGQCTPSAVSSLSIGQYTPSSAPCTPNVSSPAVAYPPSSAPSLQSSSSWELSQPQSFWDSLQQNAPSTIPTDTSQEKMHDDTSISQQTTDPSLKYKYTQIIESLHLIPGIVSDVKSKACSRKILLQKFALMCSLNLNERKATSGV